jgi:tetratricopeptide (TPR) repeat protein/transcriptional regulator with XRE-family HTH domain
MEAGRPSLPAEPRPEMRVGAAMRRARETRGVPLRALARRLQRSHSTLVEYERGHRLAPLDVVEAYEAELGVAAGALVGLYEAARLELYGEDRSHRRTYVLKPSLDAPHQLPAHTPHFVGRAEELRQLTALLDTATQDGGPVVISAINGTAGIGKTALAVHWAHNASGRFPDGQLYVNLRGFDLTGTPMQPVEAIRGFLDAFEIPPERIPLNLEAQAALYRSLLANRRVLVVLDNARDADQVRPLLPGSSTCRVVITSRNQLTSLVAQEGARPVTLDVLSVEEAAALLVSRLGRDRVTAEPGTVSELIDRCARLPLALAIVAARAALNPRLPLRVLADELRDEQVRLDALDAGDHATSVRAVFSSSYQHLDPSAARIFRLLAVHPGPDISLPATASLSGIPLREAREGLTELIRNHLLSQPAPSRFVFHDLLHVYASELTHTLDPEVERHKALHRLLDHYLHTAHSAALLLCPRWGPITLTPPNAGVTAEKLANYGQAWAWFEAEYRVLLAATQLAADTGHASQAWQLSWTMGEFFERGGYWHDWTVAQNAALTAARQGADRRGQAHAHRSLGRACPWLGRYDEAHTHLRQALRLFEELGDWTGQADSHMDLAMAFEHQGRNQEALPHAQQALTLYRAGWGLGQARALNSIGWNQALLGDPWRALDSCQESLALRRGLGDRWGEAATLDSLGYAHHLLGHHEQAIACYQQSLTIQPEVRDRYKQAMTLSHLGDTYHATGNLDTARNAWYEALDILDRLGVTLGAGLSAGYPDADELRDKLRC